MDMPVIGMRIWYFILTFFVLWIFLLAAFFSDHHNPNLSSEIRILTDETEAVVDELDPNNATAVDGFFIGDDIPEKIVHKIDPCSGKYIYVHEIPSEFNSDILEQCRSLNQWMNMCPFITNMGLGPKLRSSEKVVSNSGWFETNQFVLEVIFHNRMKQYKCLTNDSSKASAIFVPYYAGLDVARYLWNNSTRLVRDRYSVELIDWVRDKPEWRRMWGRDHFLVAGRISWDFRRVTDRDEHWGNKLMVLPEGKNMTMLTIESSPWNENDFAIPYPTDFHPETDSQVFDWQRRMRMVKRRTLFSFAGAPRPNLKSSIRNEIIEQCKSALPRKCQLLGCHPSTKKCDDPSNLMKMFQDSVFCLQPPGDSYTRRSTFDSILAGCIPVFFHPGSAYVQYLWHLPRDYTKYSVFIPEDEVKEGKASIETILSRIPKMRVATMREEVIRLIPTMMYADPRSRLYTVEDAFDRTVSGVLERVERVRKDMKAGRNLTVGSEKEEESNWKRSTAVGDVVPHPWDHFFVREDEYKP